MSSDMSMDDKEKALREAKPSGRATLRTGGATLRTGGATLRTGGAELRGTNGATLRTNGAELRGTNGASFRRETKATAPRGLKENPTFEKKNLEAAVSTVLPLTIKQGTAADKFQIVPGTVNSEMPTLAAVALDDATPPEETISATTYFWLKCVGLFGTPDTYVVTVETTTIAATPPVADAIDGSEFTSCFYIGEVELVDGAGTITNDYGGGNLGAESFGAINLWWKK